MHNDLAIRPVDVADSHPANVTGTQPQACKEEYDGAVADTDGRGRVTRSNDVFDMTLPPEGTRS